MRNLIAATSIGVIGLIVLLPAKEVAAQGAPAPDAPAAAKPVAPAAPKPPAVTGSGTPGTVPVWTGTTTLGNSHIQSGLLKVTVSAPLEVLENTSLGTTTVDGTLGVEGRLLVDDNAGNSAVAAASGVGVSGTGTSVGVSGTGNIVGVVGQGNEAGVRGQSSTGLGVDGFGSSAGVKGQSSSGIGVWGTSSTSFGVYGENSFDGTGVRGFGATGRGVEGRSTSGVGVYGSTHAPQNNAVVGEVLSTSPNGATGVIGVCQAAQGNCNGVIGITGGVGQGVIGVLNATSTGGDGIHGYAHPTSGPANGIVGETFSPDAAGVIGLNNSAGGQGVRGGTNAAGGIGVLGYNNGGGTAGQFQGNLVVTGNAFKPGGGSWSVLSDVRLKKGVEPMSGALNRLLQLRGVTFEYSNPGAIGQRPGTHLGMVAQDVEQVFPEWVDAGIDGYKLVTFRGFEAVAIEAVRELDMNSKQAGARIGELERLNAELRQTVEALSEAIRILQQKIATD